MVDKINPTSQFHPYQPADATPQSEVSRGGLGGLTDMLKHGGLGGLTDKLKHTDIRGSIEKARGVARSNPGLVLGGLAALAIGAGLMRKRSLGHATR